MKNKGFTLIELIISLAIIAILAGVGANVFLSNKPMYTLKENARNIYFDFQNAKMEAIKRNTTVILIFTPANDTYTIFIDDGAAGSNWALDADDTLLVNGRMLDGIDLFDTTIPFNTYAFSNRGMPPAAIAAGVYFVRIRRTDMPTYYYGIRLNTTGNIKLMTSTDGGVTFL